MAPFITGVHKIKASAEMSTIACQDGDMEMLIGFEFGEGARSISAVSGSTAFRASGRFIVTVRTAPLSVTITFASLADCVIVLTRPAQWDRHCPVLRRLV
jgi:hypothetical protein